MDNIFDTLASWGGSAQEAATEYGYPIDWNPLHSPLVQGWLGTKPTSNTTTPTQTQTTPTAGTNWTPIILIGGAAVLLMALSSRSSKR